MSKYHWKRRVLMGAAIGAACSLFHRETREGVKEYGRELLGKAKEYRQQPSKAFEDLRSTIEGIDYYADAIIKQLNEADSVIEKKPTHHNETQLLN
ncbi:YtxH domain-containing protein [Salinibacillus xinjiangensis]|uniref:YtxH domain-containing protein n=1 Tax=Salinibacillus xinjiangensis TaxID=1229268 RepID=A0A6G1X9A1_9BACI|nr:YtxH domain-containing protein [Salinibacillus xinjiangensis]MRG87450.1 hypothetical protein [Salinibacillus xinjiangensis]